MAGGASHLETLDYKPKLAKMDGQSMPESYTKGRQIAQLQGRELKCLAPQHPFNQHGKSGLEISAILPHIGSVADDLCVINSMQTDQINHDPAHTLMNTGTSIPGRPSMGSWLLYGLGSQSENLPGYVVLTSVGGGQSGRDATMHVAQTRIVVVVGQRPTSSQPGHRRGAVATIQPTAVPWAGLKLTFGQLGRDATMHVVQPRINRTVWVSRGWPTANIIPAPGIARGTLAA
jgi:hypothetical protein